MADSLLQSSISAVRTKIINDISSASVKDLLQLARAAKGLGLGDDTSVETAINTRVNQLSTNATIAEIKDLSSAIKQVRNEYANTINSSDDIVEGQNQRFLSTASLNAELSSLTGDIIPDADLTRNIGNAGKKFTSIYTAKVTGLQSPLDSNDAATKAYVDSNASSVESSDTAPSNPNNGDMWFKSDTLDLYVYYTDTNSSQWVQVGGSTEVSGPSVDSGNEAYDNFGTSTSYSPGTSVTHGSYIQNEASTADVAASVTVTSGFSKIKVELDASIANITDSTTEMLIALERTVDGANPTTVKMLLFPAANSFYGSQHFLYVDTHGASAGSTVEYKLKVDMSSYSNESARVQYGICGDTLYIKEIV